MFIMITDTNATCLRPRECQGFAVRMPDATATIIQNGGGSQVAGKSTNRIRLYTSNTLATTFFVTPSEDQSGDNLVGRTCG